MSYSYYLTCIDCGSSIFLGKTIDVHYDGISDVKTGFSMLGGDKESGWQPSQKAMEELQHFLFVHRGHELRVVPETVNRRDANIEFVFPADDDTADPLFNRSSFFDSGHDKADPEREADMLEEGVIQRLSSRSPT
ncbi:MULTISPECIES: hypothetical protein [unclassified Labrenzia]|uniref:hypothetical protein n=1 Tax=unclassified Labrenzia TaxID=2648686 RepID=UPI0012690539|nr:MULTISPECIES: hypothetical protein [unclassified Labrenzia]